MEVVDFTSLMQVCHHVASSMFASLLKFFKQFALNLWIKCFDVITCIKPVDNLQKLVIKVKQAMQTHPDIDSITASSRLAAILVLSGCVLERGPIPNI